MSTIDYEAASFPFPSTKRTAAEHDEYLNDSGGSYLLHVETGFTADLNKF